MIQATGGENTGILMARFYETLSMDDVKSFLETVKESQNGLNLVDMESKSNVVGYKIFKITATEDQMASIID